MAEYLIQSETLDDIADAINAKTGGSSAMTPAEMVTAIGSISGGGEWTTDGLASGTEPNGDLVITIAAFRSAAFWGAKNLGKVRVTSGSDIGGANAFRESSITEFVGHFTHAIRASNFFYSCQSLSKIVIPKATYFENSMCYGCYRLETADIGGGTINRGAIFQYCKKLQTIIIRGTTLCTLSNVSNLGNTPFAGTGNTGLTGTLYVPASLVESYKTASNWSTFYNGGTMDVLPIEGSIYETQYADGTPIPSE